jgi:phage baseplate assembly protein W
MAWKDIDINFEKKVDGDINDMVGIEAIKNSLTNIFKTIPLSRRMLPTFASGLFHLLFEPIDESTARSVGKILLDNIEEWEPRIKIKNINVYPNEDSNRYDITLSFIVINDGSDENNVQIFTTILKAI